MKIKNVKVSFGTTNNMGNYESLRLEFGAEAEVQEGEVPEEVIDHLRGNLRAHMNSAIQEEIKFWMDR